MNSDPSPKRKMSEMISEMAAGFIRRRQNARREAEPPDRRL